MKKLTLGFAAVLAMIAFGTTTLTAEDAKCGEGKCGTSKPTKPESKCGEGKCGTDKPKPDAKCGAGKCGGK
ncbi:MAG: Unknown protein [uncultured Sulfurovum sp.]|uniref:Low-complexity protein n=1 Tax=uncultured Sulfurovum sp. TaxID=269237 RepID=A0A6S6SJA6_9BACT|nr:MAG: Unknown protein [uncultured Sulfurovum sp.]